MKKKLTTIAIILLCLSVAVGGTWAYFTAEETAHNVITTGSINIALDSVVASANVTGVMPGQQLNETIKVQNTGANPAYVRVKVDKSITLATGQSGTPDLSVLTVSYTGADWTEQGGYYVYNTALAPNTTTSALNVTVLFSANMDNTYQGSTAKIDIVAQATQVANNGTDALHVDSWTETNTTNS